MSTPLGSIACFLVAALAGAIGQFLYKTGAAEAHGGVLSYCNWRLLSGVVCYVSVMVLFVAGFKQGGALTVLYPLYATTFIWAAGIAYFNDGTPITMINVLGMGLLVAGMWLMGGALMSDGPLTPAPLPEGEGEVIDPPNAGRSRRALRVVQWLASALVRLNVSPNAISVLGMIAAILAGLAFAATPWWTEGQRVLWLSAAFLIQMRLMANLLDGMVAIESGKASPVGELFNEVPDRISDAAILIGAGYALGGDAALGFSAACVALFTAYVRAMGKAAGAPQEFCGPMAKPQRMFVMTVIAVYLGLAPAHWQPRWGDPPTWGILAVGLAIIIVLGAVTAVRRLLRIAANLRKARS